MTEGAYLVPGEYRVPQPPDQSPGAHTNNALSRFFSMSAAGRVPHQFLWCHGGTDVWITGNFLGWGEGLQMYNIGENRFGASRRAECGN